MIKSKKNHTRRLFHFTPLRYPGGKAKLAAYVKEIIRANDLYDGVYIEPYAGGAAVALELMFQEYVDCIHINDISRPIYSFWKSVLQSTEDLCRLVRDTPITLENWDKQKKIFSNQNDHGHLELGFATFFLNRTNRSGILNGGVIGGRGQSGPWKIDARFNTEELIFRIESIARMKRKIKLTRRDALALLRSRSDGWSGKALIYLDPPYYEQARRLYYDFYDSDDHYQLAEHLKKSMSSHNWIVSYDNVAEIKKLYSTFRSVVYNIGYSARDARIGREAMFFSPSLEIPRLVGAIQQIGKIKNPSPFPPHPSGRSRTLSRQRPSVS